MNDPASPPSLDLGFSVEPPPLPDFDCTVDLDFDPAFARHVLERQFARLGFTNRNLIVLLVGSLVVAGFFHANPLASPVASVLAFLAAVLLFLRHRLVREAGNPRPSFSGKHRLHLTSNRYAVATEGYRMEIDWGKLAKTYFETDDAIVLLRGVSVATAFGPRVFAAAGRERLRSVLEAAGVRRHPGKRWTQASWVLWILAAFTVFCVFSSPRPDTPSPAEEKLAESAENAEPEPHAEPAERAE